eukprot:12821685-Ditylum_brightwellii.AAC.1
MYQLGSMLKCLVVTMADSGPEPFAFTKLDIKDWFWYLVIHPNNAWIFCYMLQQEHEVEEDNIILVVPTSLQMG